MDEIYKVTGQRVDHKEHNNNAPPTISAPSEYFKAILYFYANKNCSRCRGTGYIGDFKSTAGGRCFQCLPDERWNGLLGDLILTGTDDKSGESLCEIRFVSSKAYSSTGYIVTKVGLPPIEIPLIFSTVDEARKFASEMYGV